LKLHEPVPAGTAIRIDRPWEGPANGGLSVIELDGRLILYYRGWSLADTKDENGVACMAESRDGGGTWTKPALELVKRPDWPGSRQQPEICSSGIEQAAIDPDTHALLAGVSRGLRRDFFAGHERDCG
jgi:hypothetical protein